MATKDSNWHLSKSVSISHIGSTVVAVVFIILYLGDIKENVRVNSTEISNIKDSRDRNRQRYDNMFERIEDKLDKLFIYITEAKQDK